MTTDDRQTEIFQQFPDLFGCPAHRPDSVVHEMWTVPLHLLHPDRLTVRHGRAWSISIDSDPDDTVVAIVDLTWATNALIEFGVAINEMPLVAIQRWADRDTFNEAVDCPACLADLETLEELVLEHIIADELPYSEGLPPAPLLYWSDSALKIATKLVEDLHVRSILGESISVMRTATPLWGRDDIGCYLQMKLSLTGDLSIEVQRDFSYWGVTVGQAERDRLTAAGFVDNDRLPNFMMSSWRDSESTDSESTDSQIEMLSRAIEAFRDVFQPPSGPIALMVLGGLTPFEESLPPGRFATAQRMLDRMARPLVYSRPRERETEDRHELLGAIEELAPQFADAIRLAHLDELVDRMESLVVLAPVDFEGLTEMVQDPAVGPERIGEFVLRHLIDPVNTRTHSETSSIFADEFEGTLSNLAHERLDVRLIEGGLDGVVGITLEELDSRETDNGVVYAFPVTLDPPPPDELVFPANDELSSPDGTTAGGLATALQDEEAELDEEEILELADYDDEPVYETGEGHASVTVHFVGGQYVVRWTAAEGSESGAEVLWFCDESDAIDCADDKLSDLASDWGLDFDDYLGLARIPKKDRVDLPDGVLPLQWRVLFDSYDLGILAQVVIHELPDEMTDRFAITRVGSSKIVGRFESIAAIDRETADPVTYHLLRFDRHLDLANIESSEQLPLPESANLIGRRWAREHMIDFDPEHQAGVSIFDLGTPSLPLAVTHLSGGPVVGRYESLEEIDNRISRSDVNMLGVYRED